jgi:hypothetical protein
VDTFTVNEMSGKCSNQHDARCMGAVRRATPRAFQFDQQRETTEWLASGPLSMLVRQAIRIRESMAKATLAVSRQDTADMS